MHRLSHIIALAAICAVPLACQRKTDPAASQVPETPASADDFRKQLAAARFELALARAEDAPDDALVFLAETLRLDPSHPEAFRQWAGILHNHVWHAPELHISHPLPITRLELRGGSLWVAMEQPGSFNTAARWDLEKLSMDAVLFPRKDAVTHGFHLSPTGRALVLKRGDVTLLCDAASLKPVAEIGGLPENVTPSAVIAFSRDDLLMAHPEQAGGSVRWVIRDVASGEILRATEPLPASSPTPLAAKLDLEKLIIFHTDSSLLEVPVSPALAIREHPPEDATSFLHACFLPGKDELLATRDPGPNDEPVLGNLSLRLTDENRWRVEPLPASALPDEAFLLDSWNHGGNLWNGLLKNGQPAPLQISSHEALRKSPLHAPFRSGQVEAISAVAFAKNLTAIGTRDGHVTLHRSLPALPNIPHFQASPELNGATVHQLMLFSEAITGRSVKPGAGGSTPLDTSGRMASMRGFDPAMMAGVFPITPWAELHTAFLKLTPREASTIATLPLWERLALSDSSEKSWQSWLHAGQALGDTRWHQDLSEALRLKRENPATLPDDDPSPWIATLRVIRAFDSENPETIRDAIESSVGKTPAIATALALALEAGDEPAIRLILSTTDQLPASLRAMAEAHIALLRNQTARALAYWPQPGITLENLQSREDWNGWEHADFSPALLKLNQALDATLAELKLDADSSGEARTAHAARLLAPHAIARYGRDRLAAACLNAALDFAGNPDETETAFQLANTARMLGADPVPCLRAEALALTSLGDFAKAHPRWIELLTEQPVEKHEPEDYPEAAYTAFETGDARQAMEILHTGIRRFPGNGMLAYHAGWIALITDHPEHALGFLNAGHLAGFPPEKRNTAMALLAIAASHSGLQEDAAAYYQALLELDPTWAGPNHPETETWPEELTATLLYLGFE